MCAAVAARELEVALLEAAALRGAAREDSWAVDVADLVRVLFADRGKGGADELEAAKLVDDRLPHRGAIRDFLELDPSVC